MVFGSGNDFGNCGQYIYSSMKENDFALMNTRILYTGNI